MFFHVILTTQCNLQCEYCYGEALMDMDAEFKGGEVDYSLPAKIEYDIDSLARFCSRDDDCVVTFYGGEPLLCIDEIKQIMKSVKAERFILQTNGLFLDCLDPEHAKRFHTILVSIDGNEAITDLARAHIRKLVGKGAISLEDFEFTKYNGCEIIP